MTTTLPGAAELAPPVLEARGLTKHFPAHGRQAPEGRGQRLARARGRGRGLAPVMHAVDDVTLALTAAHVTAVVGESGSGKSTLARLLARLVTPTTGELLNYTARSSAAAAAAGWTTPRQSRWCCRTRSRR